MVTNNGVGWSINSLHPHPHAPIVLVQSKSNVILIDSLFRFIIGKEDDNGSVMAVPTVSVCIVYFSVFLSCLIVRQDYTLKQVENERWIQFFLKLKVIFPFCQLVYLQSWKLQTMHLTEKSSQICMSFRAIFESYFVTRQLKQ